MKTTNFLLSLIVILQCISMANTMYKDKLWYEMMKQFKEIMPTLKATFGHLFGSGPYPPV